MSPGSGQDRRRPASPGGWQGRRPSLGALVAIAAGLVGLALVNQRLARRAERRHPPAGRFVEVDGVRLHYVERGRGRALVFLHGNGSMIEDFTSSGLVDLAARRNRVIVFDRPGYGHSARPRRRIWSAGAQADLILAALDRIGVSRPIVLGHSWGASVAAALALRHPRAVRGLVLVSGYYFPTARADLAVLSGPALPLLGDVARHTVVPILGRALWPLIRRRIFAPAPVPRTFAGFPIEMAVRPSQIRASAAESALLIASAAAMSGGYSRLSVPVVIVAGTGDRLVDAEAQSGRLHRTIAHGLFCPVPGAGHMVHQTHPRAVMAAIDEAVARADEDVGGSDGRRFDLDRDAGRA